MVQYNFLDDNFTTYEDLEDIERDKVYFNMPLLDNPIDISNWAKKVTDDGIPIAKNDGPGIIINNPDDVHNVENIDTHDDDYSDYESDYIDEEIGNVSNITKGSLNNGQIIVNTLMSRLNLSKEQASGIAGVIMSESGLDPQSYNKKEKAGKLKGSSANGAGYGAGILQWSNSRKASALKLIGKQGRRIEDLSLQDQIEMLARELEGPYRNTLLGIRSSRTAAQAAATMYCHNVAGYSSSPNPATKEEIDKMNKRYSKFGHKIINRGMSYANQISKQLSVRKGQKGMTFEAPFSVYESVDKDVVKPVYPMMNNLFNDTSLYGIGAGRGTSSSQSKDDDDISLVVNNPDIDEDYIQELEMYDQESSTQNNIATSGSLGNNAREAYTYLVSRGIPRGSAAGIVGNLYHENLKNPMQTVNDSRGTKAFGIAGFNTKGELPSLMKWSQDHGIKGKPSFHQQLDYLIHVIKSRSKLGVLLDDSITPETASFIWGRDFERFAGSGGRGYLNINDPEHKKRAKTSKTLFEKYGGS